MYYKLTKEEYKKYESDFKKTYIGNHNYMKKTITFIVFLIFGIDLLIGLVSINFSGDISDLVPDMNGLFSLAGMITTGICTVIANNHYEKELKDYINTKSKK